MNEWIRVKERIPEKEKCLAIFRSKKDGIYNLRSNGWFRDCVYSCRMMDNKFIIEPHGPEFIPTHWMYLPELPENENE